MPTSAIDSAVFVISLARSKCAKSGRTRTPRNATSILKPRWRELKPISASSRACAASVRQHVAALMDAMTEDHERGNRAMGD